MVDLKKIKGLIGMNDHSRKQIAEMLNLSAAGLGKKLNGDSEFKASELKKIADLYNVKTDDLYE